MKRVTQGGDINFNVTDVRGLGDNYAFRFYTTDSCKYIVKVDGDAVEDIIRLEWDELKTLGDGVLCYYADNLAPDEDYSDGTFNRTFGGTTQWYIVTSCSGSGTSEEISELSDRLDAEIQRSTTVDTQQSGLISENIVEIHNLGDRLYSDTYTKSEVDQKIAEASYDDTALSNRVTANETALANTYRKNETYSQSEINDLIDNIDVSGDAVGVQSITQTTTSTESGGINVITSTLTDGTTSTFQIRNGLRGEKGDKGDALLVDGEFNPVTDIVNDLTSGGINKALSAEMGKRLKALIDSYESRIDTIEESAALVSVEGTTLVISRTKEEIVIVGDLTKTQLVSVAGGESITSDFFVSGRNLQGNIGITLSDTQNFTVNHNSLIPTDGKVPTTMVSVKFNPANGLAADSTHSCTVTVTYGGVTKKTMTIVGTVAASASLSLTPSSLTIKAVSGEQNHGTIRLQGTALSNDVILTLSGSDLSFADNDSITTKTVTRAEAEDGLNVNIYYTAGESNITGSLTASSTGVQDAVVAIEGVVGVPLAVGSYFDVPVAAGGTLRYTVLADNTTVSVKKGSTKPVGTAANPLVIPSQVSDADASVYNSGGESISASGMTYNVTEIPLNGFENLRTIESLVISEGVTSIGQGAFNNCTSIKEISLPSSLATLSGYALRSTSLTEIELPACSVGSFAISSISTLTKVIMNGTKIGNNAFSGVTSINELHFNDCDTAAGSWTGTAFPSCTQFTDGATYPKVYVNSVTPPAIPNNIPVFPDDNGVIKAKLYVPSGSEAAYRAANVWGNFEYINDLTN